MYVYFVRGRSRERHLAVCKHIYSAISVGSNGYQEEGLRKVAGCFLVALSERCENKRPFALAALPSLSLSLTPQETI